MLPFNHSPLNSRNISRLCAKGVWMYGYMRIFFLNDEKRIVNDTFRVANQSFGTANQRFKVMNRRIRTANQRFGNLFPRDGLAVFKSVGKKVVSLKLSSADNLAVGRLPDVLVDGDAADAVGNNAPRSGILDVCDCTTYVGIHRAVLKCTVAVGTKGTVLKHKVASIAQRLLACNVAVYKP